MAAKKAVQKKAQSSTSQGLARLVPTQQRSRERFERILQCAAEVKIGRAHV